MKNKSCPFCGSKMLYERYAVLDGFDVPTMFCNWCKCIFTVEGFEDYVTDTSDGFTELREAWNTRKSRTCYADEVTHRNCKYSVHRGWCEHGCKPIGEWRKTSQTQEVRERTCGCCGEEFGMDRRNGFPIPLESLCELPNYCPNCGTKVAKE